MLGATVLGLAFILIPTATTNATRLVGVGFMAAGFSLVNPTFPALLSNEADETDTGTILGYGQISTKLGGVIGPVLIGYLYGLDIIIPFYVSGSIALFVVFLMGIFGLLIGRGREQVQVSDPEVGDKLE